MISEYFDAMKTALKERNYSRAAGYLRMIYQNLSFHFHIYRQVGFEGFSERDVLRLFTTYVKEFPDDPSGYMMLAHMYYNKAQLEQVRRTWTNACENADRGFHFQPSVHSSIFDAEKGRAFTSLSGLGLGTAVTAKIDQLNKKSAPALVTPVNSIDTAAAVETLAGEPIGAEGAALNGRVSGITKPGRYYFRYGTAADSLTETTDPREIPAGLHGRVRDTAENLFVRISPNTCRLNFSAADMPDERHRLPVIAMTPEWPFGKDRNHLDGIGVIDLLMGWSSHAHQRGRVEGRAPAQGYPTPDYPGEEIDLRDARVMLRYRTASLDTKKFLPVIWMHGRTGTAAFPDQHDDLCAWAVTAPESASAFKNDGAWHEAVFDLPGTSQAWTFCGSNVGEMGDGMLRYTYAPVGDVQRRNAGGNLCIAFMGGDELDTPEGSIDIAEIELSYRSRSLIGPGQQAELVAGPKDAACLTDGTIGDIEHGWQVTVQDGSPVDLVWRLRGSAELTGFKIHQNVLSPASAVEVSVSMDGEKFTEVWTGTMDDIPDDPAAWARGAKPDATIRAVIPAEPVGAEYVRLRILNGWRDGLAGLDAFEVFGEGLAPLPSPEPFSFSEPVGDLEPGCSLFAQLVVETEDGLVAGEVVETPRPLPDVPVILSAGWDKNENGLTFLNVRLIPNGSHAQVTTVIETENGERYSLPPTQTGKWHVAQDIRIEAGVVENDTPVRVACMVENGAGKSASHVFDLTCAE